MQSSSRNAIRRIAGGRVLAMGGSEAAWIALMVSVYDRTHSTYWLSAGLLLTFGAFGIAGPLGGLIADRTDRRRVMVCSDLLTAVAAVAMLVAGSPALLLVAAFGSAVAQAPFNAAAAGAVPNLVDRSDLAWANSVMGMGRSAGLLIGPVAGGVLVGAVGARTVFVLFAICSISSAALVASVHGRFSAGGGRAAGADAGGLRVGFAFVARDPVLGPLALAWMVLLFLTGPVLVAELPLARSFGQGSTGYGLLAASWAAGSLFGAVIGRRLSRDGERRTMVWGVVGIAAGLAVVAVSPIFLPVLAGLLGAGVAEGALSVAEQNITQRLSPDPLRSRINAAIESAALLAFALSFAFAGFAITLFGVRGVYLLAVFGHLLGVAILIPTMRRERLAAGHAPHPAQA